MICDNEDKKLIFIKDYSEGSKVSFDLAELDLVTKKTERLTYEDKVFQVVKMDGRILIPYQSDYLVYQGKSDVKNRDNLKK